MYVVEANEPTASKGVKMEIISIIVVAPLIFGLALCAHVACCVVYCAFSDTNTNN